MVVSGLIVVAIGQVVVGGLIVVAIGQVVVGGLIVVAIGFGGRGFCKKLVPPDAQHIPLSLPADGPEQLKIVLIKSDVLKF